MRASSVSGLVKTFCTAEDVENCMVLPHAAEVQKYLMELITNIVKAVLEQDTGNMLEYRHCQSHPKFAEDWNTSSAN